ncbi:MAG: hypothetical protein ABW189_05595 [Rickettsiales bacterium]
MRVFATFASDAHVLSASSASINDPFSCSTSISVFSACAEQPFAFGVHALAFVALAGVFFLHRLAIGDHVFLQVVLSVGDFLQHAGFFQLLDAAGGKAEPFAFGYGHRHNSLVRAPAGARLRDHFREVRKMLG